MLGRITYRKYPSAILTSAVFALVSLFDGFVTIPLIRGPLINFWLFDAAKWLMLPALLMFIVHHKSHVRKSDYGLNIDLGIRDILIVLPLPLFTLFVADSIAQGFGNVILGNPTPPFSFTEPLAALGPLWIFGTIYFSITAGVWESIFFIGLPWLWVSQGRTMPKQRVQEFALVSALFFALGHWETGIPNTLGAFVFQLCAVWWFFQLKNLWPIIAAHTLIDCYAFWPTAS